jgi:DNA-binding MarR family transcriptional regulator
MKAQDMTSTYRNYLAAVVRFHLVAAEAGQLGPTDYQASSIIELDGPVTPGELADRLGLSRSATTRVIDRLVAAKIVERQTDPADRRRIVVTHTGYLPHELRELLASVRQPIQDAVDALNPEQQEGLLAYFQSATETYRNAVDSKQG